MIAAFEGSYYFLSNFSPSPITFNAAHLDLTGLKAPTVEHAFHAMKADNEADLRYILGRREPGQAKKAGRAIRKREGWDDLRIDVMTYLLEAKFEKGVLYSRLRDTYPRYLREGNYWHDNFWGVCTCGRSRCQGGENHLGKLLMALRRDLV